MSRIEVIIDGQSRKVTKQELFDLASQGIVNPNTNLLVDGRLVTAGKVKGIVFLLEDDGLELIERPGGLMPANHAAYGSDYYGPYSGFQCAPNTPPMVPQTVYVQHPLPNTKSSGIGVAVTSLVLGILGVFFSCIPVVSWTIAIFGLTCGCIGLSGEGRGMAIAGIVLNIIGLVLAFICFVIFLFNIINESGQL